MNNHNGFESEMHEPCSIRIEAEVTTTKRSVVVLWFRRIITLDDVPNGKQYVPVFVIAMSILHVIIHCFVFVSGATGHNFALDLFDFCHFFLPCIRPTPADVRIQAVPCEPSVDNRTCHYDEVLKDICFSFLYPHQLWRLLTVALLHMNVLHLISNLLTQIVQGIPLERKYGSACVMLVYWFSCFSASLMLAANQKATPAVGASGSLYGLMLFLIVDRLIVLRQQTDRRLFTILQLILVMLPNIISTIPLALKYNVAHLAHFGGGIVGTLFGVIMCGTPQPQLRERSLCQKIHQGTAFVFLCLYFVVMVTVFFSTDAPIVNSILYGV